MKGKRGSREKSIETKINREIERDKNKEMQTDTQTEAESGGGGGGDTPPTTL